VRRSNDAGKKYDHFEDQDRIAGAGFMEGIANSIRPAVQTDQTGIFRAQVITLNPRLFIRETAQPEKPL
jgi:hypothetical protein